MVELYKNPNGLYPLVSIPDVTYTSSPLVNDPKEINYGQHHGKVEIAYKKWRRKYLPLALTLSPKPPPP